MMPRISPPLRIARKSGGALWCERSMTALVTTGLSGIVDVCGPRPRLEVCELRRDDREAVRAHDNTSAPRQRRREVDLRAHEAHGFQRRDALAARGAFHRGFELVLRFGMIEGEAGRIDA